MTRVLYLLLVLLCGSRADAQRITAEGLEAMILCDDSLCVDRTARSMGMEWKAGFSGVGYSNAADPSVLVLLTTVPRFTMRYQDKHLMQQVLDGLMTKGWAHDPKEPTALVYFDPHSSKRLYVEGSTLTCSDVPLPLGR